MKEVLEKENYIYDGKILKLKNDDVILPDGKMTKREIVIHSGGVCIVAIDENKNVLLVKQFRYALDAEIFEIPAGKMESGEEPLATAMRELSEETGYIAEKFDFLGSFFATPGYSTEKYFIYLARGLKFFGQHLDDGEFLDCIKIPFRDALDFVRGNTLNDSKSVIGLLFAENFLNKLDC